MFLTRSHHEDIIREKNLQIGYRDHRIAQLEAERKLLWDKLCLLEIGEPIFDVAPAEELNAGATTCHPDPGSCGTAALGGESHFQPKPGPQPLREPARVQTNHTAPNRPDKNDAPAQTPIEGAPDCHSERDVQSNVERRTQTAALAAPLVRLGRPRPSQIMRRMDRLMHNRWLQKIRPAKSAEQSRDEVLQELNRAHFEAAKNALRPDDQPFGLTRDTLPGQEPGAPTSRLNDPNVVKSPRAPAEGRPRERANVHIAGRDG